MTMSLVTAADSAAPLPLAGISCPDAGEEIKAEHIRTPVADFLAECEDIRTGTGGLDKMVLKAGDTMTGLLTANAGITVASGQDLALNGTNVTGNVGFSTLGVVQLAGRKRIPRTRVSVSDANNTINVDQGDRFTLVVGPAAPRTITLQSTGVVPSQGETLTFFWQPGTAVVGGGTQYTFKNEGGTTLLTFDGSTVIDTGLVWAEFEFVAGAWAIGISSSTLHDGAGYYGAVKP